jgi:hypothetical protein
MVVVSFVVAVVARVVTVEGDFEENKRLKRSKGTPTRTGCANGRKELEENKTLKCDRDLDETTKLEQSNGTLRRTKGCQRNSKENKMRKRSKEFQESKPLKCERDLEETTRLKQSKGLGG